MRKFRASAIYERWVAIRPEPRVWVKWGKFEEERGKLDKAREVFQTALEFFGDDEEQIEKAQAVFNAFAKMETRLKEYERARVIYKVRGSITFMCSAPPTCLLRLLVRPVASTALKIRRLVCGVHKIRETAWHAHHARIDSARQAAHTV